MTDRDEMEKLAVWFFEKFPLAGYNLPNKFERLRVYQKDMMRACAEKLLANFVPRSEHEELTQRYARLLVRYAERT